MSAKDVDGWLPIHYASAAGHADIVQALLAAGSDVEEPAADGDAPLHKAAIAGHLAAVQLLKTRSQVRSLHAAFLAFSTSRVLTSQCNPRLNVPCHQPTCVLLSFSVYSDFPPCPALPCPAAAAGPAQLCWVDAPLQRQQPGPPGGDAGACRGGGHRQALAAKHAR